MKKIIFIKNKKCCICKEKLCVGKDDKDYINRKKVNYTEKFRGTAHSKCNFNFNVQKEIPIIIHNATYDYHKILKVNLIVLGILF